MINLQMSSPSCFLMRPLLLYVTSFGSILYPQLEGAYYKMYNMYIYICIGINVGLFQCCDSYSYYRVLPHIYKYERLDKAQPKLFHYSQLRRSSLGSDSALYNPIYFLMSAIFDPHLLDIVLSIHIFFLLSVFSNPYFLDNALSSPIYFFSALSISHLTNNMLSSPISFILSVFLSPHISNNTFSNLIYFLLSVLSSSYLLDSTLLALSLPFSVCFPALTY